MFLADLPFVRGWHARACSCKQQAHRSGRPTSKFSSAFYYEDRTESQVLIAFRSGTDKEHGYCPGKWPGILLADYYTTFPAWCSNEGNNEHAFH